MAEGRGVDEDRLLARLNDLVVEELRRRGHPADRPVTIGELCDEIAPYGAVRTALDVEIKADYDHAILRFLAGAGHHVRLEPDEVREELQRVLAAPYPDVGAYREFAAARAWIDFTPPPEPVAPDAGPADAERERDADDGPDEDEAAASDVEEPDAGGFVERAPIRIHRKAEAAEGSEIAPHPGPLVPREGVPCSFCEQPLPVGRRVRFCPFCGGDQRLRPCPGCDAALERDWSYCVRCGRAVDDPT